MDDMPISDSVPTIYSDAVKVNVSPTTFTMIFSRAEPWIRPPQERELVRIQMSPTHFKLLVSVLPQLLTEYENNVGEISVQGLDMSMSMEDQPDHETGAS
jgi:hypothetical protein